MKKDLNFVERCRKELDRRWKAACEAGQSGKDLPAPAPEVAPLRVLIRDCLASPTKSYHYVLPTQLLSKCVDPDLDCRALQASFASPGAFDARTVAHEVIVPFDQQNHRVLGGSSEPYVNNPLRCPAVVKEYRAQQKAKEDWDKLAQILGAVEQTASPAFTGSVLDEVLRAVYDMMANACVVYPVPNRVSLRETVRLITDFTKVRSRGERIEIICAALFRAIAQQFHLFDEIRRKAVNASDAVSGAGADIECLSRGHVTLLVEVKDRSLTLTQLDSKLGGARARRISEILFLAEQGIERADHAKAEERIRTEFTSGQNVYVSNFADFSAGLLILLGEKGRVVFLRHVGEEMERTRTAIGHRQAWAALLKSV